MRSAQFGVYDSVLSHLRKSHSSDHNQPVDKLFGILDPHIIIAGFSGIPIPIPFLFLSKSACISLGLGVSC